MEPENILLRSHVELVLDFERTFDTPSIFSPTTTTRKKYMYFNLLLAAEERTLW